MKRYALLVLLFLAGCAAATTGPIPSGDNTYTMSRQDGISQSMDQQLLVEVVSEATLFCHSTDRTMNLLEFNENPGPYNIGNQRKVTLTFSCDKKK